ncbi:uncharacterized protein PV09_09332 [Verruconis gallopava]|uniref:CMP/dCMP-type deaminase domain-containing protein n=1 Tax=Verruconis gallopava TaxID=253628 RepID=A0A0D1ZWV1_9PEZI|nr:uncharacterized protein PV09_09332 [Verruconis gallopava]KIV98947.1 hypothetical protein PV09_09332 [Verruconis gallopava]
MKDVTTPGQARIPAQQGHDEKRIVRGTLTPLRTKAEVQASTETASAYIVEVPNQSASDLLNVLRGVVPAEVTSSLQHLRRFVKPEFLPRHIGVAGSNTSADGEARSLAESSTEPLSSPRQARSTTSHVLVCPTATISLSALERLFQDHVELFKPLSPEVREIVVPIFAPTSAEQASSWSEKYWPTIYRNTNPYGPHPSLVKRAELELVANGDADRYVNLARCVADCGSDQGLGIGVGAVVVERVNGSKKTRIVAVAGDARFADIARHDSPECPHTPGQGFSGNVMGHAVLRAIAMVAQKRRVLAQLSEGVASPVENEFRDLISSEITQEPWPFTARPVSDLEELYLKAADNLTPNGYLCLDLEIYLTHEPCVMCAMAILHSRFSRVVFGKRVPKTGALYAEQDSLGHGLFWRDQLNWKFFVWQWRALDADIDESTCNEDIQA